jgi:PAS domain S-box-containing protein
VATLRALSLLAAGLVASAVAGHVILRRGRRRERAPGERGHRFDTLAAEAPVGNFETTADGKCTYVNRCWCELSGLTAEASYGWGWTQAIHPDDKDRVLAEASLALREAREFAIEYRVRTAAGKVLWVAGRAVVLRDQTGRITGYLGTVTDLTRHREADAALARSEQQLRTITDAAPFYIAYLDADERYRFVNRGYAERLGLTPADVLGKRPIEVLGEAAYESIRGDVEAALAGEPREFEADIPYAAIGPHFMHVSYVPDRDPQGAVRGFVAVVTDVTSRRRVEDAREEILAEAERARAEAEAANRAKDHFLAMLAHELRNPLAAVRSAVVVAGLDAARRDRALTIARRQTEQLARLVDDLLDVARVTQGRIQLRRERVPIALVIERAVESTRSQVEDRGHTLVVALDDPRLAVHGDPHRLDQIVTNLLDNAAKYTPPGGRIEVRVAPDGETLVLRVRDSGVGIAPGLLPHVFDLFMQGDRSLHRGEGGLGLGLTIVRKLVELHGGRVEARSGGAGQGSEFVVTLPTLTASEAELMPSAAALAPAGHARVLLVEDNVDAADSLTILLELLGHEVRVVYDGLAALDAVRAGLPDVVLLDIGLPGLDGYEVARRIRRLAGAERVVLIALTGYGRDEDRARTQAAGFDLHLVKPVDPEALQGVVARFAPESRAAL